MMRLLNMVLVRHGQTDRNDVDPEGRILSNEAERSRVRNVPDQNVELTPLGRLQAAAVGRILTRDWGFSRFDTYFDSGYRRSIQTLDLVLESFPESERAPAKRRSHLELREREPGYTFNMTIEESRRFFPWWHDYEKLFGPVYSRPPGGESIADVWERVHGFINSLPRSRPGRDILIVAHGRVLLGFKYWLEKGAKNHIEAMYEQTKQDITNGEIWWYRYNEEKHRYFLVSACTPIFSPARPRPSAVATSSTTAG